MQIVHALPLHSQIYRFPSPLCNHDDRWDHRFWTQIAPWLIYAAGRVLSLKYPAFFAQIIQLDISDCQAVQVLYHEKDSSRG